MRVPDISRVQFSKREMDVMCLLVQGLGNIEIGQRMGIGHRTVKHYLAGIFVKAGISHFIGMPRIILAAAIYRASHGGAAWDGLLSTERVA